MGVFYFDHLEYDLTQDKGDESNRITFREYFANKTEKWENTLEIKYSMQLSLDNDHNTIHFMYFPHYKV